MQTKIKNLDGISVVKTPVVRSVYITPLKTPRPRSLKFFLLHNRLSLAVAVLMFVSFGGGMLTVLSGIQTPAVASSSDSALIEPRGVVSSQATNQTLNFLSQQFGNLIQDYQEGTFTPEQSLERKERLKTFLASKHSPWATEDKTIDTLLGTRNMRMILAISFVESNYGKHCSDNNCSGIGVDPSVGSWHKYKSYANWVLDFDRLLERHYKNWTPEEMRGVYVSPGSDNWVAGIYQVLDELDQAGIK